MSTSTYAYTLAYPGTSLPWAVWEVSPGIPAVEVARYATQDDAHHAATKTR